MLISDSRIIWNALNGVICVYKPAGVTSNHLRQSLITNICKELNELKTRPIEKYVNIEGETNKKLSVNVQESYADHPLVVGPRYQPKDVRVTWCTYLSSLSTGVMLYGINNGTRKVFQLRQAKPTRAYSITGKFGEAMDNYSFDGAVMERSTYNHVKRVNVDRLLAHMQSSHQAKMFELCGVDMNSQAGYELAIQGPIRPVDSKIPLLYGIKCVHFQPPEFAIEVQCINEYSMYLRTLIHDIGMQLKSTAHCTAIKCIRHSYFTEEDALLPKHFQVRHILENMMKCSNVLKQQKIISQQKIALQQI